MAVKDPQVISPLPLPPNPADRSTFNTRAYPWSNALAPWTTQTNQAAADTYANAVDSAASATSADASKNAAAGSASTANTDAGLAAGYRTEALASKNAAAGSASTANTSSSQAVTAKDEAQQWATSLTTVSGGLKGSRGYAQDAAQSAADAAAIVSGDIFDDSAVKTNRGWTSSKIVAWVASWWGGVSSVTPATSKAVVSKSDGKIDSGWLDAVGSGKALLTIPPAVLDFDYSAPMLGAGFFYINSFIDNADAPQPGSAGLGPLISSSVGDGFGGEIKWFGNSFVFRTNGAGKGDWKSVYHTSNTTKSPDGTLKASTVSNMAITHTGDNITRITEDGVQTNITYNADGTINTMVYPQGGKTRTETFTYSSGRLTGMTATEV